MNAMWKNKEHFKRWKFERHNGEVIICYDRSDNLYNKRFLNVIKFLKNT
jgi:hypothetical protein